MRKLRFRAWNKEEKRMSNPFTLFELAIPLSRKGFTFVFNKDDLIIMQYTGLTDKKGKEIYEGDVIEFKGLPPMAVKWQGNDNRDYNYGWNFGRNDCEIIGNIYENPKLEEEEWLKSKYAELIKQRKDNLRCVLCEKHNKEKSNKLNK